MSSVAKAFISYVHDDRPVVESVVDALESRGISVWVDYQQLAPGVRWRDEIRQAIRAGGAFVPCLSTAYFARERTYMNDELLTAVDEARLRHRNRAWLIPLRLDGCSIPAVPLGAGEVLSDIQALELFPDFDKSIARLAESLRRASLAD